MSSLRCSRPSTFNGRYAYSNYRSKSSSNSNSTYSRIGPAIGIGILAGIQLRLRATSADCAAAAAGATKASAVGPTGKSNEHLPEGGSYLQNLPVELTIGGFLGFSAVKIGKVLVFFVGGLFVFVQYLVHKGWVTINWQGVESSWTTSWDRDGDGKVTFRDIASIIGSWIKWLTFRIPSATTFSAGFYYALSNVNKS
ncbi:FUN14 domain-containing protein 1 [Gonapodya sp. JEL0774]|nr:FUN14 domain-containing protein 1 [Gonapodya sp. JEL0774]